MTKRTTLAAFLAVATLSLNAQKPMTAPKGGKAISDELIGIFFEDISSSADGGLYAELVQNGSFEFNPNEKDGWGPTTAWKTVRPGHSLGKLDIRMTDGIHPNNPTYLRLHTERAREFYDYKGWRGFGLENGGFDGISVKAGAKYNFSAFFRNIGAAKQVRVVLGVPQGWGRDPKVLAETTLDVASKDWKKYCAELTASEDCKNAILQILVLNVGDLDVDMVSLMPQDTYKGHGLRKDLAQALADLHPKFMRFPGGCVVHGGGDGFWDTYRWKTTIGPKETRRSLKNTWGYHQSMGLGYFEYFQFCEDLGMEPLPILPCGVSCQGTNGGWNLYPTQAQDVVPMSEMDEWVAEAIDLIEWANGDPATNKWAKMRADAGHPEPFNLKYLGLGNEEKISPEFNERFKYIYERVTKAHPEIVIVGTAGPGSHPGNADLENGWKLAEELGMPIIDEHYYEPNAYFLSSRQYNYYPRDRKTKVYLGEYAAKDKKLIDALAEGLYLLHVEQNGDIVTMTSYAPLFAKKNATNWNPDMIYFDNERTYPTCSYYVQQLFGQSSGQYYYGDCVTIENPDVAPRWRGLPEGQESGTLQGQSVVLNVKTRKLYVKLVNAGAEAKKANIDLSRFGIKKNATITTLTGKADDENNYEKQPIAPQKQQIKAKKKFSLDLDPYTMVMLEYQL
ncbi:MAG: alpha-N-arabinofuranosidase [Prevotella sp.]|nr:alpha-N-arabinofuranosidase [Prevotella sp.]